MQTASTQDVQHRLNSTGWGISYSFKDEAEGGRGRKRERAGREREKERERRRVVGEKRGVRFISNKLHLIISILKPAELASRLLPFFSVHYSPSVCGSTCTSESPLSSRYTPAGLCQAVPSLSREYDKRWQVELVL